MKKLYLFLIFSVIGLSVQAVPAVAEDNYRRSYGDAFIFTEGGVEFAIFPDGQFDFFYHPRLRANNFSIASPNINISYNAGYNYDPFIQYDDFGAVVQIENVPIYYDFYGRIVQAGRVQISYNHFGRLSRIGNLYLHYNPYNRFTGYSGYINARNPYYVHRPWHRYYMRPHSYASIVYYEPYRAYYNPHRMQYKQYRNYYKKNYNRDFRKSYYRPGQTVASYHRGRRTESPREVRRVDEQNTAVGSFDRAQSTDRTYTAERTVERRNNTMRSRSRRSSSFETPQASQPVERFERREQMSTPRRSTMSISSPVESVQRNTRSSVNTDPSETRQTRSSRGRN